MHPCPGNWVAIWREVVYYALAVHAFSAGMKCWHNMYSLGEPILFYTYYTIKYTGKSKQPCTCRLKHARYMHNDAQQCNGPITTSKPCNAR